MAYDVIYFENPLTGQFREAPVGFSWTTLLFGPFPMLFRGNWKWFAIVLLLGLFTFGLTNLLFMFIINKQCIRDLINDGFKVKSIKVGPPAKVASDLSLALPALNYTVPSSANSEFTLPNAVNGAKSDSSASKSFTWILAGSIVILLMFALLGGESEKSTNTTNSISTTESEDSGLQKLESEVSEPLG